MLPTVTLGDFTTTFELDRCTAFVLQPDAARGPGFAIYQEDGGLHVAECDNMHEEIKWENTFAVATTRNAANAVVKRVFFR